MINPASIPNQNHFYRQVAACMPRTVKNQPKHVAGDRNRLNADIEAFLSAGGCITIAESETQAPKKYAATVSDSMGF